MRGVWAWLAAAVMLAAPMAARAEWYEASSDHFLVFAEGNERDVRTFSQQLERYHRALEIFSGLDSRRPSPSNRVTIYVLDGAAQMEELAGQSHVAGFYIPRAGNSVAYVPRAYARNGKAEFSMIVLLHEYAHHFLYSNSDFPTPRWMTEGAAEFFATAEFARDGTIRIGLPATHRIDELQQAINVRARELLDPDTYRDRRDRLDAFYGKSWLLYHYLTFAPERQGQMAAYLAGMISGKSSREAAEEAFGDLNRLEGDLVGYQGQRKLSTVGLNADLLGDPAIALRPLSAGEQAIMPVVVHSRRGVSPEKALALLPQARAIAARFPDDPAVLAALAEAEVDAGNDEEAIAAADRAIARDPQRVNAYLQKGYALFRRAREADDAEAAYRAAVQPFVELNPIENDHPLPLIYFYRSFTRRELAPTPLAVQGLERAAQLAPFDLGLRYELAQRQALEGRLDAATGNLVPIAYNPHGRSRAEHARTIIEQLARGPLTPDEVRKLFSEDEDEDAEEGTGGDGGDGGDATLTAAR